MTDNPLTPPTPEPRKCPICHAPLNENQRVCWLCQQALDRAGPSSHIPLIPPPLNVPPPLPEPPPDYSFSLSTLMLAMTLIAVLSGLCASAPGVGVPLAVVALFAWIHTVQETRRIVGAAPRLKILKFLETFALITVFLVAGFGAIAAALFSAVYAICIPNTGGGRDHTAGYFYAVCGAVVAVLCFFLARYVNKLFNRNRPRNRFGERL